MKKELNRVALALEEFRKLDQEMPLQMALAFVLVALNEGQPLKFYAEELGISQSSMSRNVAALGKVHRHGTPGHDLMGAVEDPYERRRKIVTLTTKGKRVAQALASIIGGK